MKRWVESLEPRQLMAAASAWPAFPNVAVSHVKRPPDFEASDTGVADFNEDGVADVAMVSSPDEYGAPSRVFVMFGVPGGRRRHGRSAATGTFARQSSIRVPDQAIVMRCADLDGDGHADIVVATNGRGVPGTVFDAPGKVRTYYGRGDGTFRVGETLLAETLSHDLRTGDFDGDGQTDLAWADSAEDAHVGALHVALRGPGGYERSLTRTNYLGRRERGGARLIVGGREARGEQSFDNLDVADFDGDGRSDLVVTGFAAGQLGTFCLLSRGDGRFTLHGPVTPENDVYSPRAADLDGDGDVDFVVSRNTSTDFGIADAFLNRGGGRFRRGPAITVEGTDDASPIGADLADMDGDGRRDLVMFTVFPRTIVQVRRGLAGGAFEEPAAQTTVPFPVETIVALTTADLNGDGRLDLVAVSARSNVVALLS